LKDIEELDGDALVDDLHLNEDQIDYIHEHEEEIKEVVGRIWASPEEKAAQEHVEHSIGHYLKTGFIFIKLGVVITLFIFAILAYRRKRQGRCTGIPILLTLYIFILIGLLVLDLTKQIISGYFFLIFIANFINLTGFMLILRNMPGKAGKVLWQRTKFYFIFMLFLYGLVFTLSFFDRFKPVCTSEKVYPAVLNFTSTLFIINYFFHLYLNCNKKYFLSENDAQIGESLLEKEWDPAKFFTDMTKEERVAYNFQFHQKMFKKQMDTYLSF